MRLPGVLPHALASCVLTVAPADSGPAGRIPVLLADYALHDVGLSAGDLRSVELGEPVARSLDAAAGNEVAIFAVIKVGIAKEEYLERLRDIARLKQGDPVLQIGRFSQPPRIDDLAGLTLDEVDVEALKECRVGDCHFALTTDAIGRVGRELDPSVPDFAARAESWVRRFLLDRVREYLARGDAALPLYTSRRRPVDVGAQFHALLEASPPFFGLPDALRRYLRDCPAGEPATAESFVYWSKEDVGPKPVISLTHVVVLPDARNRGFVSVASKQIYASHYFEASLGLTVALDDASRAHAPGMYLVYLNRSRSDALGGFMGPLKRAIVRGRSRAGAEEALRRLKRALETTNSADDRPAGVPREE
jgi:hypothetical protein